MKNNPTFTVYVGPMFGAKTSMLLMSLERYRHQHKNVAVFKPSLDDRYDSNAVVTHSGWTYPAHAVKVGADILEVLSQMDHEPDVVAVDEAFMIPNIAEVLTWLYRSGISIIASTLDISASGKPFREVEKMLVWATRVEKCSSVCTVCGQDAFYTHKKAVDDEDNVATSEKEEIRVGGADFYESRCAFHHPFIMKHLT